MTGSGRQEVGDVIEGKDKKIGATGSGKWEFRRGMGVLRENEPL